MSDVIDKLDSEFDIHLSRIREVSRESDAHRRILISHWLEKLRRVRQGGDMPPGVPAKAVLAIRNMHSRALLDTLLRNSNVMPKPFDKKPAPGPLARTLPGELGDRFPARLPSSRIGSPMRTLDTSQNTPPRRSKTSSFANKPVIHTYIPKEPLNEAVPQADDWGKSSIDSESDVSTLRRTLEELKIKLMESDASPVAAQTHTRKKPLVNTIVLENQENESPELLGSSYVRAATESFQRQQESVSPSEAKDTSVGRVPSIQDQLAKDIDVDLPVLQDSFNVADTQAFVAMMNRTSAAGGLDKNRELIEVQAVWERQHRRLEAKARRATELLRREREAHAGTAHSLRQRIAELEAELRDRRAMVLAYESQHVRVLEELGRQVDEVGTRYKGETVRANELEARLDLAVTEAAQARNVVETLEDTVREMHLQAERLSESEAALAGRCSGLQSQVEALTTERDDLLGVRDEEMHGYRSMERELENMRTEYTNLQSRYDETISDLAERREAIRNSDTQFEQLRTDHNKTQIALYDLKARYEADTARLRERHNNEVADLKDILRRTAVAQKNLQGKVSELEADNEAMNERWKQKLDVVAESNLAHALDMVPKESVRDMELTIEGLRSQVHYLEQRIRSDAGA
eukprot:Clim_evm99s152 gene=Clim_evmTU99s152